MMVHRHYFLLFLFSFIFSATNVVAADFPSKTIKIIVPFSPGGGSDVITRLLAEKIAADLGVSVLVENKPGASSIIGTDAMAKSPPDGYTILMTNRAITVNPWLFKLPYDTSKLTPVAQLVSSPLILVSSTSAPFTNLKELIAYAKANPQKVSIGNSGVGQLPHLAAVLFQKWAKSTTSWQDSASSLKRKLASWREALARGNQRAGLSWLLTISNWIIKISIQAILYGYLLHLSFSIGVLCTLSTELAAFLPIQGLAGIGTFEASSAVVMRAEGVPWMEALQVAAQVHVMMLASSLLWAFVSMFALPLTQQKKVSV